MQTISSSTIINSSNSLVFECPIRDLQTIEIRARTGDIRLVSGGGSNGLKVYEDESISITHDNFTEKIRNSDEILKVYAYADNSENVAEIDVYGFVWTNV